jgi:hypothetical protein
MKLSIVACILLKVIYLRAQDANSRESAAGYPPELSGGTGYVHNVDGGVPTLEPARPSQEDQQLWLKFMVLRSMAP